MLQVYSDCSFKDGQAVLAAIVVTGRTFIGSVIEPVECESAHIGEVLALERGLQLAANAFRNTQAISCYCDNESAVKKLQYMKKFDTANFTGDGYDAVMRIREIMRKHNVSFYYIRGHKTSRDSHVVCDFSSRILLTRILKNAVCSDCAGREHSLQ